MLRPLSTHDGVGMAAIEGFPWHKHVAAGAAWMVIIYLVQNHYGFLHMAVHKVYLEVRLDSRPTLAPLHGA